MIISRENSRDSYHRNGEFLFTSIKAITIPTTWLLPFEAASLFLSLHLKTKRSIVTGLAHKMIGTSENTCKHNTLEKSLLTEKNLLKKTTATAT